MTDRTALLLEAIRANPRGSYREWMEAAGLSSTSVVAHDLEELAAAGKIRLNPGKVRSVELAADDQREKAAYLSALEEQNDWLRSETARLEKAVAEQKARAIRAERFAAAWKAAAKGWRAAAQIECEIEFEDRAPLASSV